MDDDVTFVSPSSTPTVESMMEQKHQAEREWPDEDLPEIPQELKDDDRLVEELEDIRNPNLREKSIKEAERIKAMEKDVAFRQEAGRLTDNQADAEREFTIRPIRNKASFNRGLASVGLSGDKIGELAEEHLHLFEAGNSYEDEKRLTRDVMIEFGPDTAQEIANRLLKDGRVNKDFHQRFSRRVRLKKMNER